MTKTADSVARLYPEYFPFNGKSYMLNITVVNCNVAPQRLSLNQTDSFDWNVAIQGSKKDLSYLFAPLNFQPCGVFSIEQKYPELSINGSILTIDSAQARMPFVATF